MNIVSSIAFSADGLVPAIAQQHDTGEVLMMAWMSAESLDRTLAEGRMVLLHVERHHVLLVVGEAGRRRARLPR